MSLILQNNEKRVNSYIGHVIKENLSKEIIFSSQKENVLLSRRWIQCPQKSVEELPLMTVDVGWSPISFSCLNAEKWVAKF